MKKVLIISSTPRENGNSELLAKEFARGAKDAKNDVELLILRDKKVNYCKGCGICAIESKPCPQKDDVAEIVEKMIQSDVIVLATPVYFYSMSAQMKTLIDRSCVRYLEISNKEFYYICTSAESPEENPNVFDGTITSFNCYLDCLENPVVKGKICAGGVWLRGDVKNHKAMSEAYNAGKNL